MSVVEVRRQLDEHLSPEAGETATDGRPEPHDVARWANTLEDPQPAVITDLLLRGQILGVAGEEGDGKTLFAQQVCHQLARGEPVLGVFSPGDARPRRILFVDTEMTEDDARPRAAEMARRGLAVDPGSLWWVCTGALDLSRPEDQLYIDHLLDTYDADFVWIDAGASAVDDPSDTPAVRAFFGWLQTRIRDGRLLAGGITLHPRKRAQGEYSRRFDDLFGSREWKGKLSKAVYLDGERLVVWKDRGHHLHRRFPSPPGERFPRAVLGRPGLEDDDAIPFVLQPLAPVVSDGDESVVRERIVGLLRDDPDRYTKSGVARRLGGNRQARLAVLDGLLADRIIGPDRPRANLRLLVAESSDRSGTPADKTAGREVPEPPGTDGNNASVAESSTVPAFYREPELRTDTDGTDPWGEEEP